MKKTAFLCCLLWFCAMCVQAQDVITKRNGEDIQAKIIEVNPTEIKYKAADNPDGPVFVILKDDVLMVRYSNGKNEVFEQQRKPAFDAPDYGTAGKVAPGMSYRDYKGFYRPSDYRRQPGDPYVPAVGGVCSFIIPGLGQMICGEVGRGFGYLGGAVGCCVLMGVGSSVAMSAAYNAANSGSTTGNGGLITGSLLTVAGSIGLLVVDICAIVDGVRVAKVKNMYEQDMRKMQSSTFDMRLQPYVSTVSVGTMQTPVAGVSMSVTF